MQLGVGVRQAQRHAVGRTAKRTEVIGFQRRAQVRRKQRQRLLAPVQALAAKVQVGLAAERANGGGAQLLDPLLLPGSGLDVGGSGGRGRGHGAAVPAGLPASAPAPSA